MNEDIKERELKAKLELIKRERVQLEKNKSLEEQIQEEKLKIKALLPPSLIKRFMGSR